MTKADKLEKKRDKISMRKLKKDKEFIAMMKDITSWDFSAYNI